MKCFFFFTKRSFYEKRQNNYLYCYKNIFDIEIKSIYFLLNVGQETWRMYLIVNWTRLKANERRAYLLIKGE